jgi:aminoglycoside phosphotransferase (APT) family kinase protein
VVIDAQLARRLVAAQFPQWADLPVEPVPESGIDNRTFRLGSALTVRMPSAEGYAAAVEKEQRWLPELAPRLPLPIPAPVAAGRPGEGYPFAWSVLRWLPGSTVRPADVAEDVTFATDLAGFLAALHTLRDGPPAGRHSFYRGCPPAAYDEETRRALAGLPEAPLCTEIWDAALAAEFTGTPGWFHGDIAPGNLLLSGGRLSAVIDFGTSGVGDPACDTVIAWTVLRGAGRAAYRAALPVDDATWVRGRGWALWKALITLPGSRPVLDEILAVPL